MPSPHDELCLLFGSPVPTQTMLGSEGAMQMSPIEVVVGGRAPVFRPPPAPRSRSNVERRRIAIHNSEIVDSSTHDCRTDRAPLRSEERRIGKECRSWWSP